MKVGRFKLRTEKTQTKKTMLTRANVNPAVYKQPQKQVPKMEAV